MAHRGIFDLSCTHIGAAGGVRGRRDSGVLDNEDGITVEGVAEKGSDKEEEGSLGFGFVRRLALDRD